MASSAGEEGDLAQTSYPIAVLGEDAVDVHAITGDMPADKVKRATYRP
jgi:hypothetical protein